MTKYQIIYVDPPWDYRGQSQHAGSGEKLTGSADTHYSTMPINDLCAMSTYIDTIADIDCLLFMWVGSPILPDAMRLIDAWGFTYMTVAFVWNKIVPNPGYYTMSQCELCLVAKHRGGKIPQPRGSRSELQYVVEQRREHSRKPDEVRQRIELMFPTQSKIELFARVQCPGWDVYGNEVEKFEMGGELVFG